MVNVNTQSVVQIPGPGHTFKYLDEYEPGEYSALINAEIIGDSIVSRHEVKVPDISDGTKYLSITTPYFIGKTENMVLLAGATVHQSVEDGNVQNCWAVSNLTGANHKLIGFFEYNNTYYWLTRDDQGTMVYFNLYKYTKANDSTKPYNIVWSQLTKVTILTLNPSTIPYPSLELQKFFLHKDRLWMVFGDSIKYSKTSDPTSFASPLGGFFNFPDDTITDAVGISDTLYILGTDSVFALTYSADPASDSQLRKISDTVGGSSIVLNNGTPYFISNYTIYAIQNNSVIQAYEARFALLNVNEGLYGDLEVYLTSYQNYLVINRRLPFNTVYGYSYVSYTGDYYTTMFLNLENGSRHIFDFTDCNEMATVDLRGLPLDFMTTTDTSTGQENLFFLNMRLVGGTTNKGHVYMLDPQDPTRGRDYHITSTDTLNLYKHRITIEIPSFMVDGMEYFIKKLRSCLILGIFPFDDMVIKFNFDNQDPATQSVSSPLKDAFTTTTSNGLPAGNKQKPPYPHRIRINQRCHTVSIRIETLNPFVSRGSNWAFFRLKDMRFLWTYSQRAIEDANGSPSY